MNRFFAPATTTLTALTRAFQDHAQAHGLALSIDDARECVTLAWGALTAAGAAEHTEPSAIPLPDGRGVIDHLCAAFTRHGWERAAVVSVKLDLLLEAAWARAAAHELGEGISAPVFAPMEHAA